MVICGQLLNPGFLQTLQTVIDSSLSNSRRMLSRELCQHFNWRSITGKLQEGSCRKTLAKLNRLGLLTLPQVEHTYSCKVS